MKGHKKTDHDQAGVYDTIQHPHSAPIFLSPFQKFVPITIFTVFWDISKLSLLSGRVETNPGPFPIDENPVFCCICSSKLIERFRGIVMHNVIKPAMIWQPTKLAMQNLVDLLLRGNALNMTLVSLMLSSHLHQFLNYQIVLLLQVNFAQSCCTDLAYHCDASSCANVCHFSATCSGFLNLRGSTRAGFYSNLALSSAVFTNGKWAFINPTWHLPCTSHHSTVIKLTLEPRHVSSWR